MGIKRKALKKLKNTKALEVAQTLDYDDKENVVISVGIKKAEEFFNPYCQRGYEMINPELLEYIYQQEKIIPLHKEVTLDIQTECNTSNKQKKVIRETVRRQHAEQVVIINRKLKTNLFKGLACFLAGLLILFLAVILENKLANNIITVTIMIIAWMLVWDAAEILIFDHQKLRINLIKNYRLLNAQVHIRKYSKTEKKKYNIPDQTPLK